MNEFLGMPLGVSLNSNKYENYNSTNMLDWLLR